MPFKLKVARGIHGEHCMAFYMLPPGLHDITHGSKPVSACVGVLITLVRHFTVMQQSRGSSASSARALSHLVSLVLSILPGSLLDVS